MPQLLPQQRAGLHQGPVRLQAVLRRAVRAPAGRLRRRHRLLHTERLHLRRAVRQLQEELLLIGGSRRGRPVHPRPVLRDDHRRPGLRGLRYAGETCIFLAGVAKINFSRRPRFH